MGVLDRILNKRQDTTSIDNKMPIEKRHPDATYGITQDGRLQVEFYDNQPDFKQFYGVTRLIINQVPLNMGGESVYNCIVSWYGISDCHIFNRATGRMDSPRASEYKGVLAQIDLDLLQNDPQYCETVMKGLLNKKRVERYLEQGLQENPGQPCGKYIGGVAKKETGYNKFFKRAIGVASHYSPHMINKRQKYREKLEAGREAKIASKQAEIARIQAEIDDICK